MGRLPFFIDSLIFVLLVACFATQVIIPLLKGTKLFPFFDKRRRRVEDLLEEAHEEAEIAEMEAELKETEDRVAERRSGPPPAPPEVPKPTTTRKGKSDVR